MSWTRMGYNLTRYLDGQRKWVARNSGSIVKPLQIHTLSTISLSKITAFLKRKHFILNSVYAEGIFYMFYYFLIFLKAKVNQQGGNKNLGVDGEKETAHLFSWLAALLSNYKEKCSPTERSRWNGTEVEATWQLSLGCLSEVREAIRSVWRPFPRDWASLSCNAAVSFPRAGTHSPFAKPNW